MPNPVPKFAAAIPQGILNVPSDLMRASSQTGTDIRTGAIRNPKVAASDFAGIALPIATIASFGGAGSIAKQAGQQSGDIS